VLRVLDLGCLDITLVLLVFDRVDMMAEMMMKTMVSSRSLKMDSLRAFLVIDDKGGEDDGLKLQLLLSVYLLRQTWHFRVAKSGSSRFACDMPHAL
jgi:hypothetical protein